MTFKERLQKEHPECIGEDGWCLKCPCHYGYEEPGNPCPKDGNGEKISCRQCWNRKIPEEMSKSVEKVQKTEKKNRFATFTLKQTGRRVSVNPANIVGVTECEDGAVIFYFNDDFDVRESYEEVMRALEEEK